MLEIIEGEVPLRADSIRQLKAERLALLLDSVTHPATHFAL